MWFMALATVAVLGAQSPGDVQQLFEAGQYDQVVAAAGASEDPSTIYLGGLSLVELGRAGDAQQQFERLAARPEDDAWHHIGRSAALLYQPGAANNPGMAEQAAEAAAAAVATGGVPPQANFQLGLAQSRRGNHGDAAAAFESAIAAGPRFAYSHYYAGMEYYQTKRIDLMAGAFEAFLKLAPDAPERARIASIMRTLRGR